MVGNGLGAMGPDAVPGAAAEHPHCVTPEQFFAGKPVGRRVVILDADGYFMASSIAEMLADQGRQVTIVTSLEKLAPMTDLTLEEGKDRNAVAVLEGVHERVGHWVEAVRPAGDHVQVLAYDIFRDGPNANLRADNWRVPQAWHWVESWLATPFPLHRAAVAHRTFRCALRVGDEWPCTTSRVMVRSGDCLAPRLSCGRPIFDGHRIAREFEFGDPERPKR